MPGRFPDTDTPLTSYMSLVDSLAPTHFWPMQGNYLQSHGTVPLTSYYSGATSWITGPMNDQGHSYTPTFLYDSGATNANVNTTAYSYGGWFQQIPDINVWYGHRRNLMGNWSTNGTMIYIGDNSNGQNNDYAIYHNGSILQVDPPAGYVTGEWFHIMIVWNGTTQFVYWDGVQIASVARTGALGAANVFNIGTYGNRANDSSPMSAAYAGWWVNRALTPTEVRALANGPSQMVPTRSRMMLSPSRAPNNLSPEQRLLPSGMSIRPIVRSVLGASSASSVSEAAEKILVAAVPQETGREAGTLSVANNPCGTYGYSLHQRDVVLTTTAEAQALFTAAWDTEASFVVIDGDLTVNAAVQMRPSSRKLFTCLYVTGDLTVNGEISMSQRGGRHPTIAPFDVPLVADLIVPATGGLGATSSGMPGGSPDDGTGGGGAGYKYYGTSTFYGHGNGADGTCFSGGSSGAGSGTAYDMLANPIMHGTSRGGAGGINNNTVGWGVGNLDPGNATPANGGTGGTLLIFVGGAYKGSGSVTAAGAAGAVGTYGSGGGSGGGHVSVFCGEDADGPRPTALGGPGGANSYSGGAGGKGSTRVVVL